MRWCRGDIRRQIEFFDPLVTIPPRALINPPFGGGSCPKSVTHVSPLICHPCPPTIPGQSPSGYRGRRSDQALRYRPAPVRERENARYTGSRLEYLPRPRSSSSLPPRIGG